VIGLSFLIFGISVIAGLVGGVWALQWCKEVDSR
jgi:hypothetical protein